MDFTYEGYSTLIQLLKDSGYVFSDYHKFDFQKTVILRHDIDSDISKAVVMAEIENQLNVKSTYFVLVSSDFYNVFSKKNTECLMKIRELGHEIGLHFDEVKYSDEDVSILEKIEEEIEILEKCLGENTIKTVSMHRPSQKTLDANYKIRNGEIINSYGEEFFKKFKYLSDSRMHWREDVVGIIKSGQYDKIHLLTHAFWYEDDNDGITQKMTAFIQKAKYERYQTLSDNIHNFETILGVEKLKML